jgi:DNA repair exonuclease SbcCD nuclease subunit
MVLPTGFTFVHAADLHLDSPFRGMAGGEVPEGILRKLRSSTFDAFDNLIQLCLDRQADFLLLAGDIFDAADRSLRAQLKLRDGLQRLAGAGMQTLAVHGNHDHCAGWRAGLTWPEEVFFFPPGEVLCRPVLRQGQEIARVYGTSYPQAAVADNLAAGFLRRGDDPYAIALLHCNVGGLGGHDNYAPCRLEDLLSRGFDYWALGHIHARQVLSPGQPLVVYPGSTQGRHAGETGPKGCYVVKVHGGGAVAAEFVPTDCIRWARCRVNISGLATMEELLAGLEQELQGVITGAENRSLVVRLELNGRGSLHRELSRSRGHLLQRLQEQAAADAGSDFFLWPESLRDFTRPEIDRDELAQSETLLGDLLELVREARQDGALKDWLIRSLAGLTGHAIAGRYIEPPGEAEWERLLNQAEDLALDLLEDGGRS